MGYSNICSGCIGQSFASVTEETVNTNPIDILVIGDAPTSAEVRKGQVMTGPALGILIQTMDKVGLPTSADKVRFTTAIKCAYPKIKGKAIPVEVPRNCHGHILDEIREVNPKIVIILGKTALQCVSGDVKIKVTSAEGRVLEMPDFPGTIFVPIKHPALIQRSPGEYKPFLASLQLIATLYQRGQAFDPGTPEWQVVREESFDDALQFLTAKGAEALKTGSLFKVAADLETTDLDYRIAEYCILGVCFEKNKTFIFPIELQGRVHELYEIPGLKWIWHHGKYDSKVQWRRGVGDIPHHGDTIYQHYVLDETSAHDLGSLTKIFLQAADYKFKMNQNFKAVTLETYEHFFESLCERAAVDCSYTYQLEGVLYAELEKEPRLLNLYENFIMPLSNFLSRVERNGMLIYPDYLLGLNDVYERRLAEIRMEIQEIAADFWDPEKYMADTGRKSTSQDFTPSSTYQVQWMLYDRLKLKPRIRKGKGTSKEILASIEPSHPLVNKILELRSVTKERSTYVKGLLNKRDADGRIRSNFSAHITATGRLSSKEPNVQNIPSAFGVSNVRKAFVPAKGKILMEVDYSGAELRWLACLSGCPVLTKIFVEGINLHDYTATSLYGEDFTKQDRMRAKAANFGIMYGREAKSFKDEFDISMEEAEAIVRNWLDAYPGAKEFLGMCANSVLQGKYLETPFHRRRRFGLVTQEALHALQNEARNFPIQSTSSDTLLAAVMELEAELSRLGVLIINLVHDSVVLEVPAEAEIIQHVGNLVANHMKAQPRKMFGYEVPFESDIDMGFSWGELVSFDYNAGTVNCKIDGEKKTLTLQEWLDLTYVEAQQLYDADWYQEVLEKRVPLETIG